MRICVLSDGYPPWERGGAQRIAAQLAEGYAERGHEVSVVTTVPDRSDVGRSTVGGVTIHRLWTPRWRSVLPYLTVRNPLVVRPFRRLLADIEPDVVHAHNAHYLSNGALRVVSERGVPLVKTFHDAGTVSYGELTAHVGPDLPTDPVPRSAYEVDPWRQLREEGPRYFPLRNRLNRRCLNRHVDVTVSVSDALGRALEANGIRVDRTIRNGVDASAFVPVGGDGAVEGDGAVATAEPSFRESHGIDDEPVVLFGGRTSYNKGGEHLAEAFSRVAESVPRPPTLLVTGDDGYVPEMRRAAAPYGDRIVSTGWIPREDLRTALRTATVVASPSVHLDPFPTVNLEAFAGGTPVVTSTFGGAKELVDDGVDGRVVDPTDRDALADALADLAMNPARAARFGAAGRRKVERDFTVGSQVAAYLDVFAEIGPDPELKVRAPDTREN